jgi:hypothetical protein
VCRYSTVHQIDAKAQMVLDVQCNGLPVFKRTRASGASADDAASDDEADELMAEEAASSAAAAANVARGTEAANISKATSGASGDPHQSAAMARIATELVGLSVDGSQILLAPRLVEGEGGGGTAGDRPAPPPQPCLPAAVQALLLGEAVTAGAYNRPLNISLSCFISCYH